MLHFTCSSSSDTETYKHIQKTERCVPTSKQRYISPNEIPYSDKIAWLKSVITLNATYPKNVQPSKWWRRRQWYEIHDRKKKTKPLNQLDVWSRYLFNAVSFELRLIEYHWKIEAILETFFSLYLWMLYAISRNKTIVKKTETVETTERMIYNTSNERTTEYCPVWCGWNIVNRSINVWKR